MNKYCAVALVGTMLLAVNAWAAEEKPFPGESPRQNQDHGQPRGEIVIVNDGASNFRVIDEDQVSSLTIVTDPIKDKIRETKRLQIQNRGSNSTIINTANTWLTAPLTLPGKSNVEFVPKDGKWESQGVMRDNTPPPAGAPASGVQHVPPVSY